MKKVLIFSCALAVIALAFKAFTGNRFKSGGTGVRGGFIGDGNPQYAGGAGSGFIDGEGNPPFAHGGEAGNGFTDGGGGGAREFAADGDKAGNG